MPVVRDEQHGALEVRQRRDQPQPKRVPLGQ
jgi:hypothetical protein